MDLMNKLTICRLTGLFLLIIGLFTTLWISMIGGGIAVFAPLIAGTIEVIERNNVAHKTTSMPGEEE